jgi:hypothetical protein
MFDHLASSNTRHPRRGGRCAHDRITLVFIPCNEDRGRAYTLLVVAEHGGCDADPEPGPAGWSRAFRAHVRPLGQLDTRILVGEAAALTIGSAWLPRNATVESTASVRAPRAQDIAGDLERLVVGVCKLLKGGCHEVLALIAGVTAGDPAGGAGRL